MRTMKSLLILFAVTAALAIPMSGHATDLGALRMSYIEGDVQINNEDTGEWVPASSNMPLRPGDRLWVPSEGKAEIQSRSGTIVRLDRNTSADVLRIEDHSTQLNVNSGAAYVNSKGSDDFMQVDTPVSSIRINNRSKLNIEVADSGNTNVMVFAGKAAVEDRGGITDVRPREALVVERDQAARIYDMPLADDWDRWNMSRDKMYSSDSRGSGYLPEDLKSYSHDLDDNGRWVDVPDYGWVWTPRTVVAADWAPYRTGRWVWMGGDYVWVSYEPWGWAPYHYGRWAYNPAFGWFWVPPRRGFVYWGPGYVGWVRTATYVSWVPLAPGEIYYGRGYYGPQSVNVTNVNVNIYKTVNVYKNVNVNNSVTVVNHQSFVSGNYHREKFDRNRYLSEKISVGGPNIAPTRDSRIPVIKQIHANRMPPARISNINIVRVKEDRKLVRNENTSVMRPGARIQQTRVETVNKPLDRQEIRKAQQPGQDAKRDRNRYIQPGQSGTPDKDGGRVRRDDSIDRGKKADQRGNDRLDSRKPADDRKMRPLRPDGDAVKNNAGKTELPQNRGDRFEKAKDSSHSPAPASPVRSHEEKARFDSRGDFKGKPAYKETEHPAQPRDKAAADRHQAPADKRGKIDGHEKPAKPEKDAKKEHRENIKDEGEGRHGK